MDKKFNFQELQAIVATLRGENGCPWDKSQTHESLKLYTLEEAYEVNQAVSNLTKTGDCTNLREELGDLLFQVLLQSQVAKDNGEFAIEDVIDLSLIHIWIRPVRSHQTLLHRTVLDRLHNNRIPSHHGHP